MSLFSVGTPNVAVEALFSFGFARGDVGVAIALDDADDGGVRTAGVLAFVGTAVLTLFADGIMTGPLLPKFCVVNTNRN